MLRADYVLFHKPNVPLASCETAPLRLGAEALIKEGN